MNRTSQVPPGTVPLANWGVRAVGAVADAVVIGTATYVIDLAAGIRARTGYLYLDLGVSFVYSFVLVGFWSHTLGMAWMRLDAVEAVEGRTPIGPSSRSQLSSTSSGRCGTAGTRRSTTRPPGRSFSATS